MAGLWLCLGLLDSLVSHGGRFPEFAGLQDVKVGPRLPGSRPEQPFYRFTVIFGSRFHPPMWKPWFRFRGFSEPKLWFGVGPSFNSKPHPRSPQKSNAGAGVPGLDLLRHVCGVGGPCRPHFFLKCSCPPCYGRNSTMVEPEVLESSYPE